MFIFGKINKFKKMINLIISEDYETNDNYALEIKEIFNQSISH
jgi:hypothetical protein